MSAPVQLALNYDVQRAYLLVRGHVHTFWHSRNGRCTKWYLQYLLIFFPQVVCLFVFVMMVATHELIPQYSQSLVTQYERMPFTLEDYGFNWEQR